MTPRKLDPNSHIRVISPSRGISFVSENNINSALSNLNEIGFKISFGSNVSESDIFNSSSIESRIDDLFEAFEDNQVDGIFTTIGGYNTNQLLSYIDFENIKNNPKIICGYSDVSVLLNAIYFKTGLITYLGPHFSSWAIIEGREYTDLNFNKCCMNNASFSLHPSEIWSEDAWFENQTNRNFHKDNGYWILNHGYCKGIAVGGNLSSISLLFGTDYFNVENKIIYLEDIARITPEIFDRLLQSLLHQRGSNTIKGILIGKFLTESKMTKDLLIQIINSKKELQNIPIIANVNFGHTMPMATLPIGGEVEIDTNNKIINILNH